MRMRLFSAVRALHADARAGVTARVALPAAGARSAPAPTVYAHTRLTAALVGRPNVGKSTLFNRLAAAVRGRQNDADDTPPLAFVRSVVHPLPGITRDSREAAGAVADLLLTVVDTPGLESEIEVHEPVRPAHDVPFAEGTSIVDAVAHCEHIAYRRVYAQMKAAAIEAVHQSNLILFIIDASVGVTALDHAHAKWLRSVLTPRKSLILVANKCDVCDSDKRAIDAYELGFGDPVLISAEQALGFADLYERIRHVPTPPPIERQPSQPAEHPSSHLSPEEAQIRQSFDDELVISTSARLREQPLQRLIVSIIGRPNVGKSTLLNALVGEQRSIVATAAGVTRDAVLCPWRAQYERSDNPPVWLIDTPGVRAESKVNSDNLERLMVRASLQALRSSHVVVVVMEASESLTRQDLKLLDVVITEGRAVVLVVNKMDALHEADLPDWRARLRYDVDNKLEQLKGVEVVEMSAKYWENDRTQGKRLYDAIQRARGRWEKRVPTSALNRFVKNFNERMSVGGGTRGERRNRIGVTKFITQKKIRPPMFRLDGSSAVSMNYLRSLSNAIRHEFGFEGVPIRVKRPSRRKKR
eukprot:TRINITY_DN199_c0_g2_i1.p1 TRINITY_DN199_c0_g2~~TRINITY_DN199_c0_g2_i1.p1  ORF type:complete len:585 (-),score=102.98 TRINITY_DN199_c0_g2_i1:6643-8397(-)